ncbi:hypothetical protein V8E53_004850 [Lactarius tabidus]
MIASFHDFPVKPSRLSPLDTAVFVLFTFTAYQCFHHLERRFWVPLLLLCFITFLSILLAFATYGNAFTPVYRLSPIHPLARYPRPTISKTSKLWGPRHAKVLQELE